MYQQLQFLFSNCITPKLQQQIHYPKIFHLAKLSLLSKKNYQIEENITSFSGIKKKVRNSSVRTAIESEIENMSSKSQTSISNFQKKNQQFHIPSNFSERMQLINLKYDQFQEQTESKTFRIIEELKDKQTQIICQTQNDEIQQCFRTPSCKIIKRKILLEFQPIQSALNMI